jgi:ribosomal-protein-alanine N-acetyltransferase
MKEALSEAIDKILNSTFITRIQARCSVENIGSEMLLKSIGMQYEGLLKRYWFIKNQYKDVKIFALLANKISNND